MPAHYRFITRVLACGRWLVGPITCALLGLLPLLARAGGPGWQPGFNTPGLNGPVRRVVQWQGNSFIAGGDFTDAGGQPAADHVARWNGRHWQALGVGPGFTGSGSHLIGLVALPDGDLVAAGGWNDSAAAPSFVTRWNGWRWQRLGPAFGYSEIRALAAGPGGELLLGVVGGEQGAPNGLLRWTGTTWQALEPAGPPRQSGSSIDQLVVTPVGHIVAVGELRRADGRLFSGVGRWAGAAWQPLGTEFSQLHSLRLAVGPDGAALVRSPLPEAESAQGAARPAGMLRWDGAAWQAVAGQPGGPSQAPELTLSGDLLARGRFRLPGDTLIRRFARSDGTRWRVLSLPGRESRLGWDIVAASAGGELLVQDYNYGLLRWDGRHWQKLADTHAHGVGSYRGTVRCLAQAPNGDVVLSGYYANAGQPGQGWHVSRWNGRRIRQLGPGFHGASTVALTRRGRVFVNGRYQPPQRGADTIRQAARWHYRRWQSVDRGLPPYAQRVVALAGEVVASGCGEWRRWRGGRWQPGPAAPAANDTIGCVQPRLLLPGGELLGLATGSSVISSISDSRYVVRGHGGRWRVLGGEELPFDVLSLAVAPNGDIYAAGEIRTVMHQGTSTAGYVLRWDGCRWQALGEELNGGVNAVAVAPDGSVYIGGAFEDAGGNPRADYVARWDGRTWQALGAGLNREVHALVVARDGAVIVGGDFTLTGDEALPVFHFGIYREPQPGRRFGKE